MDKNSNTRSVGKEIGILSRCTHKYFQHKSRDYSIGHAQVGTLHLICRHDGINQKELIENLHLDKSSVTSQIERLEKNGYITRKRDKNDQRGKRIYITKKTEAIKHDLIAIFSGWSSALMKGFTPEEKETVFCFLDKMKTNAFDMVEKLRETDEKNK
ncbi:MAG: MarR family transcriptional regulator [Bacteroidota bacterium]|nr:MarR family transcriptional regulator [Bacteroidota bacterium]